MSVFFQHQLGLGLSVIGAIYLPISVPYVNSSIVVGKLTDKLVRLAYSCQHITPPTFWPKLFVQCVVLCFTLCHEVTKQLHSAPTSLHVMARSIVSATGRKWLGTQIPMLLKTPDNNHAVLVGVMNTLSSCSVGSLNDICRKAQCRLFYLK